MAGMGAVPFPQAGMAFCPIGTAFAFKDYLHNKSKY